MRNKERNATVDFVRIISMLSVILLHATSAYIFVASKLSLGDIPLSYMINQGVRYCVPLFFLLSGLSLELSFREQSYAGFLSARAKKIVLPYLLWTAIYYFDQMNTFVLQDLIRSILLGTAAPHLYFIIALVQLYFVYIPLHRFMDSNPKRLILIAFFVSMSFQWAIYLSVFQVSILPTAIRPYILKTGIPWLFCFVLGMLLARNWSRWKQYACNYRTLLIVATVLFAGLYIVDSHATNSYDLSVKPILFLYVPLVFLCLTGIGEWVEKSVRVSAAVQFLSKHSMTVFFCHILILNHLRDYPVFLSGMRGMLLLCVLVTILSILFALIYDALSMQVRRVMRPLHSRKKSQKNDLKTVTRV